MGNMARGKLIFIFVLTLISVGEGLKMFSRAEGSCPSNTTTWTVDCNKCICWRSAAFCTHLNCSLISSLTRAKRDTTDETCTPGEKFKIDCNDCICDNDGEPECSRRLCP